MSDRIVRLTIPGAEVFTAEWAPPGIQIVMVPQNPLFGFPSDYTVFVKAEWIVEDDDTVHRQYAELREDCKALQDKTDKFLSANRKLEEQITLRDNVLTSVDELCRRKDATIEEIKTALQKMGW